MKCSCQSRNAGASSSENWRRCSPEGWQRINKGTGKSASCADPSEKEGSDDSAEWYRRWCKRYILKWEYTFPTEENGDTWCHIPDPAVTLQHECSALRDCGELSRCRPTGCCNSAFQSPLLVGSRLRSRNDTSSDLATGTDMVVSSIINTVIWINHPIWILWD